MKKIDSFKNRLAKALSNKQMKAITLSEIIHINRSSISQWLSGVNEPNGENLINIAKALNVSEMWLLCYDVPMNNEKTTNKEEIKGTAYLVESDILDQELAKKMVQILANDGRAISAKRAYKIIDIAKSLVDDIAYIYYKD